MLNAIYVFCFVTAMGLSFAEKQAVNYAISQEDDPMRAQTYAYSAWDSVRYFPREGIDEYRAHAASYFLFHMDEPVLKTTPVNEDYAVVRLSLITSFGPMFVFRFEERDEAYLNTRKVGFTTYGGWGPVERVDERFVQISKAEFDAVLDAALHASTSKATHGGIVFDGATWVLEVAGRGPYLVASEHSPDVAPWHELACTILASLPNENPDIETEFRDWTLPKNRLCRSAD